MHIVTNSNLAWTGITTVAISANGHCTYSTLQQETEHAGIGHMSRMPQRIIIKPTTQADEINLGTMQNLEFKENGKDKRSRPATSFNRMCQRLQETMRIFEDNNKKYN